MKFEDLESWKISRNLVSEIYILSKIEPLSKDFGLKDQIQRAAVSVMTNIAEGFERTGKGEKLQFYNVARASAGEVRSLLYVVADVYPVLETKSQNLQQLAQRAGKLISGLIRSTR